MWRNTNWHQQKFSVLEDMRYYVPFNAERDFRRSSASAVNACHHPHYGFPYLWTSNMGDCVSIGLLYQPPGDSSRNKIELYHSMSEHGYRGSQNLFMRTMVEFFREVEDSQHLKIYVASRRGGQAEERLGIIDDMVDNFNDEFRKLGKRTITKDQFILLTSDETFFLTQSGQHGTVASAIKNSIICINSFLPLGGFNPNANYDSYDWNTIFKNLKTTAETTLLNAKDDPLTNEEEIDYLKLLSWDVFLNAPSEELLNEWLLLSSYTLSPEAKAAVLNTNSTHTPSPRPGY